MIFKLKCKSCGNVISYDTNMKHKNYQQCDKCEQIVDIRTETKLTGVMDLDGFELVGIERKSSDTLLDDDLVKISNIYDGADDIKKSSIVNIIEKLYIILKRKDNSSLAVDKMITNYFIDSAGTGFKK